ncbi:hypothetical protein GNI_148070 [Gregarina niphandrodes]|uniref:Uncharacterized protein n=1 Tax=Gregarina niphandrodes TaxID=110365 RepID=A0A023AZT4_GRENI|nr:hypothetical protein GNI_148070 [Gregarina niphandrodes]EZG44364.1 hypothetical protein GNI_148070 [Gregarina niphandrodes]|eukprot:XP_011132679.1 hypothetical protein GNI_148070 [Gregarina niphandrodes]
MLLSAGDQLLEKPGVQDCAEVVRSPKDSQGDPAGLITSLFFDHSPYHILHCINILGIEEPPAEASPTGSSDIETQPQVIFHDRSDLLRRSQTSRNWEHAVEIGLKRCPVHPPQRPSHLSRLTPILVDERRGSDD